MTTPLSRPWAGMAMKWAPSTSTRGRKWIEAVLCRDREEVERAGGTPPEEDGPLGNLESASLLQKGDGKLREDTSPRLVLNNVRVNEEEDSSLLPPAIPSPSSRAVTCTSRNGRSALLLSRRLLKGCWEEAGPVTRFLNSKWDMLRLMDSAPAETLKPR